MCPVTYNLYPEVEPYLKNHLRVSTLHHIYYEECGNPTGKAVIFLHGGPGSGCNPMQRRFFDPAHYRIILMDQRGCGRSLPLGETRENTTDDLVEDIERLRKHLSIHQWQVFGGSWGSTLALAYAVRYADAVSSMILRGIFLSRPTELHWFLGEVKNFFPEAWEKLCAYLPEEHQDNLLAAYEKLVFCTDKTISIPAAIQWNAFEGGLLTLMPRQTSAAAEDHIELARARVQIHYIQNHCFVNGDELLQAAQSLHHIPTAIIQGRYDMVCPPVTAWQLAQNMPHAEFIMIPDAGHSATESGITSALVAATEKFKAF